MKLTAVRQNWPSENHHPTLKHVAHAHVRRGDPSRVCVHRAYPPLDFFRVEVELARGQKLKMGARMESSTFQLRLLRLHRQP